MKMRKIAAAAMAGALAVSLAACGSSASTGTTATGEAAGSAEATEAGETGFTVQLGPNPETLDPALNASIDGGNTLLTIEEPLLIIDENNEVQPGQAESYTVSEDGLTWTFTLRDGLKWSDGSDLTAADFEYSFKRLASPDTAAPYAETVVGMIDGYQDAIGNPDADGNMTTDPDWDALNVHASEDGKTLTIQLSYPCSYFDKLAAFVATAPVQQATVEANGDAWCTEPDTFICNGPYMITEWTPSERIVLSKNPYYVGGWDSSKIVSDTITLLLLEDSSASYAAYNSGEAQLVKDVPTDEIPSLTRAEDGGDFYLDEIMGTYYISLNDQEEPFTDVRVRKALSLAIDRDYVANTIMQGIYTPATALVGPGIVDNEGYFMDNANGGEPYIGDDYEANLEEAKQLMAEAGYPDGEGFPTITYSANDAGYHIPVAEYLQQAWGELGITMNIDKVEWSSFIPMRRAGDYDISRNGWSMDYNDPSNMLELFTTNNGNNDGKYANPAFDQVIEDSRVADKAAHFEKLHEAEDILMNDAACIPVAYYNDFWLQSPSLKGTWHSPYGYWYLQYGYVEG
ncbi:MAG: peptide ABC transporter substrate-binding protein [Subdoligranulum variabile]|uniref:peptide ABC transporter substrate-binding protein n=1 Tax=Gemmiger sp. TaxID=2049027 RepID=UPI002A91B070|nr:peptide ABC transporter substrate-binding protein [Gemmiger sp.]MDD7639696.1 peptide ABC transporter substrate-binding protein [Subdoligranulum variabile]MDY5604452.1 peptide ABC transporter substrate-binding protein [Gemmiger sp.]